MYPLTQCLRFLVRRAPWVRAGVARARFLSFIFSLPLMWWPGPSHMEGAAPLGWADASGDSGGFVEEEPILQGRSRHLLLRRWAWMSLLTPPRGCWRGCSSGGFCSLIDLGMLRFIYLWGCRKLASRSHYFFFFFFFLDLITKYTCILRINFPYALFWDS